MYLFIFLLKKRQQKYVATYELLMIHNFLANSFFRVINATKVACSVCQAFYDDELISLMKSADFTKIEMFA